jgi:hypothetical protein
MKGRRGWLGLTVLLTLLIGPILGLSLYLDLRGIAVPGEVIDKRETINFGSRQDGTWSRRTELVVRYQATDRTTPQTTSFGVDAATYDRLAIGAPIAVRYPPNRYLRDMLLFPTTRPADQSTLSWLRMGVPFWVSRSAPLALVGGLLFLLWRGFRVRLRGLGWLLAAYLLGALLFLIAPAPDLAAGSQGQATTATVRAIHRVEYVLRPRSNSTRKAVRTIQPYDLVELQFVPAGQTEPVVAVDAVDRNSVPNLAAGATIAIAYSSGNPRGARIVGGGHTHAWKNLLGPVIVGITLAIIGIAGSIMSSALRKRLKARAVALGAAVDQERGYRRL